MGLWQTRAQVSTLLLPNAARTSFWTRYVSSFEHRDEVIPPTAPRPYVAWMRWSSDAAYAIASCVGKEELSEDYIIPSVFNRKVAPIVAKEVSRAAHRTKVARRTSRTYMEIHLD